MQLRWRALRPSDLSRVMAIAGCVHPAFPEDEAIFAERLRLYPAGMRLLEAGDRALGYLISHPWRTGPVPALNRLLGGLPERPDIYYLHDLALLPAARGTGAAGQVVEEMAGQAMRAGLARMGLVAVNGSVPFWQKQGFAVDDAAPPGKLASYGGDARLMERLLAD